jgi:hypothetical protein
MDTTEAANTFTSMLHAIDVRDWDGVRAAFADEIDIDYSSLFGVPRATVGAREHVAGWEAFARHFDVTQHVTGPIVMTSSGPGVIARTHVRAYHRMKGIPGGETWIVAGHYEVGLRRIGGAWKIVGITLRVFYQDGNISIPDAARSRAASAPESQLQNHS